MPASGSHGANTSHALPGFYCKNIGHNPQYIPFHFVNDGICDYDVCCDGSDEWLGTAGVHCPDRCKELGTEWRKQNEARQLALTTARKRRKEMATEAIRLKKEAEDWLRSTEAELQGFEQKVEQLEKEKEEIERTEKSKVVRKAGEGGKASVLMGLVKDRLRQLREAANDLKAERDNYRSRVLELEGVLRQFHEEYNPNFNDEGVKRAVHAWEDYGARDKPVVISAERETDIFSLTIDAEDEAIPWSDFEGTDNPAELELLYKFEAYLPSFVQQWVDGRLRSLREMLIANGILPGNADAATAENPVIKAAADRLRSAQNDVNNLRNERKKHEEDIAKDYGPDGVFRALKGSCVELESGEYTYELCWMDKVTQKSKKGGAQNNMGTFTRLGSVEVDEDISADGKGLGSGTRITMHYENGAHCWQGPHRSTTVVLACAKEEQVWKVVEDEKCVYSMHVGTSAVCESPVSHEEVKSEAGIKDEL